MQAIIYTRVSSDEQVQGTSLAFQEEICRKYCHERGIGVLAVFREEGESAKTADRAQLLRALEYCRKHKGTVHAFVVAKVDRFARQTEDHFYVRKRLLDHGVTLHSVTEPIGNSPTEKFVETVLAASAEFDNAVRKQRCTDGMLARLNQGIWPWKPPPGYLCQHAKQRGEKKHQPDAPNPRSFPLIQRALKEYARGVVHSQAELARLLDTWGLCRIRGTRTTEQFVDRLLGRHLSFYAGFLVNPWTGEVREGRQEPMISEAELNRIRLVRAGKARVFLRDRHNPLFPLRRTVLCTTCRRPLTGSVSHGNGGDYPYYHCENRSCSKRGKTIRKSQLEGAVLAYLAVITPSLQFFALLHAVALDYVEEQARQLEVHGKGCAEALAALEARRRRVFEMREDGTYTKEMFQARIAELDLEVAALKERSANSAVIERVEMKALLAYAADAITRFPTLWHDLPPALRVRFHKIIFPEGIPYDRERGIGTTNLGLIYELNRRSGGDSSHAVDLMRLSWNRIIEHLREFEMLMTEFRSTVGIHGTTGSDSDKASQLAA